MNKAFHYILIGTLVACFLGVPLTSYLRLHNLDYNAGEPRSNRQARGVLTDHHQLYECYDVFTQKIDALLTGIKRKSALCKSAVENDKKNFDLRNGNARKAFQSKLKTFQDATEACGREPSAAEYFKCFFSIGTENRDFLDDIRMKSRQYSYELNKIENDERKCLGETVDETGSFSAYYDLQRCILESSQSALPTSSSLPPNPSTSTNTKPKEDEPIKKINDEIYGNLTTLYNAYVKLRECKNNKPDSEYQICRKEATSNKILENYLRMYPVQSFPKLEMRDIVENICLRHLAAEYITRTSMMGSELEECLKNGREDASYTEYLDDLGFSELMELYSDIKNCGKHNRNRSERKDCVIESLSRFDVKYYSILDEYIDQIVNRTALYVSDDGSCIRYALKKLQFSGVFMDDQAKEAFERCFYN